MKGRHILREVESGVDFEGDVYLWESFGIKVYELDESRDDFTRLLPWQLIDL